MQQESRKKKKVFGSVVFVSLLMRVINLDIPIGNDLHAFRQTQTAMTVQNYFQEGWSLFHYKTPVFGEPWQVLMECPIYQTAVYAVMRVLNLSDTDFGCRLVSLLLFYLSAVLLKKVADMLIPKEASAFVCGVYLLSAFNIFWSREAMIDYMSVFFALLYVWGLYGWLLHGTLSKYMAGLFFGCLGYLLKATTMFPYVYLLMFLIITQFIREIRQGEWKGNRSVYSYLRQNRRRILLLALVCILPVIAGAMWTYYADCIKEKSLYTAWLTSENLHSWNYGTLAQKLDFNCWKVIIERLYCFFGDSILFWALLAGGGVAAYKKQEAHVLAYSFISCMLAIITLFNLYYVHDYYLIAVSPLICMFFGILLYEIKEAVWKEGNTGRIGFGILLVVMLCLQVQSNRPYIDGILYGNKQTRELARSVNQATSQEELVVIEGEDWSPVTLYYAQRKGFMVKMPEWILDEAFFEFLHRDNYTTLVAHSLDTAGLFSQHYDAVAQYPGSMEGYVYKLFRKAEAAEVFRSSRIYDMQADGETGTVLDWDAEYMQIHYADIGASREVTVEVTDRHGNVYTDKVNLPTGCEEIYYKVGALCEMPAKVRFI